MLDTDKKLEDCVAAAEAYVQGSFGLALDLKQVTPTNLPHFILDRYRLWQGSLLNQQILVVQGNGWKRGEGFTSDFVRQRELLRDRLGVDLVILLLDHAPAPVRKQLVSRKIGFIAPGSQLYIPEALLDLRERTMRARPEPSDAISPTAQLILLAVLLGEPLEDASQTDIAKRLQVAIMSISRALDELENLEIAKGRLVGRQRRLRLLTHGAELWVAVKNRLRTPIRKVREVHGALGDNIAPRAGESALAHYTMLSEPRVAHRAIAAARWKEVEELVDERIALEFDDAPTRLETWSYDPTILARNGTVDPLSLHLSVRHNLDERVAQAAEQLLEPFGW